MDEQTKIRNQLRELDERWSRAGVFKRLNDRCAERNADDLAKAWRAFKPRSRKVPKRAILDLPKEIRDRLIAKSKRRVELLFRIFQREEKIYKDERSRLLDTIVPRVGKRWRVVETTDGGMYRTVGFGKNRYAHEAAEAIADRLRLAGIPVEVCEAQYCVPGKPPENRAWSVYDSGPTFEYHVNALCEKVDLEAAPYPSLRETVRLCWKRGVNPRVYNPFLPYGFEEREGLDYFGNDLRKDEHGHETDHSGG